MRPFLPLLLTLTLAAAPVAARAQSLDSLPPAARLRIDLLAGTRGTFGRARTQTITGALHAASRDSLRLAVHAQAAPLVVPRSAMRAVWVSHGPRPRWLAAARGALLPAVGSAAFAAATAGLQRGEGAPTAGEAALSAAVFAGVFGAVRGAWSPGERWRRVPLPERPGR